MREGTMALIFIRSGSYLLFGLLFAALSYARTRQFKRRTGINPWHIDPIVWAIATLFIAVFGTVLSLIACATTRVPERNAGSWLSAEHTAGGYNPIPVTPQKEGNGAPSVPVPAGWHRDPSGRHQLRYWDGSRWTEHVASGGQMAIDPLT